MTPNAVAFFKKLMQREVFFETHNSPAYPDTELMNVHASKCYSCGGISIWHADELIYPVNHISVAPNEGMPADVKADFLEANEILDKSPRGAAALLRLGIQKLMIHLGEKGKNINDDIASLVRKGLDTRIQKALDLVRVVGNSAVHPGQIDLDDNKTIATKLFGLVNVIVESQITQAKHIEEMYEIVVPDNLKAQIDKRDAPKQIENKTAPDATRPWSTRRLHCPVALDAAPASVRPFRITCPKPLPQPGNHLRHVPVIVFGPRKPRVRGPVRSCLTPLPQRGGTVLLIPASLPPAAPQPEFRRERPRHAVRAGAVSLRLTKVAPGCRQTDPLWR
jgi:hypothetical protein